MPDVQEPLAVIGASTIFFGIAVLVSMFPWFVGGFLLGALSLGLFVYWSLRRN